MQWHRRICLRVALTVITLIGVLASSAVWSQTGRAVIEGGLMSYGIDVVDQFRQAAGYVDRILKGTKPAELPVQLPAKFVMSINLRTAKGLGLDVPLLLQQRADEVID